MVQGVGSNENVFWGDEESFGRLTSNKEFGHSGFESFSAESGSDSVFQNQVTEAADFRINQTEKRTIEEKKLAIALLKLRPLGLPLPKTPSLIAFIEEQLIKQERNAFVAKNNTKSATAERVEDLVSQQASEKLKASNFPATSITIGTWQRFSRHEGDLVAKCYYAKRRLVWEFLEGGLKRKIELQWSDITAIEAVIKEDEPGQLKIELNSPPTFFQETNPQPRKHTNWQPTTDFSGGQASACRRHYLKFPPGALDRHYEKLLQCDNRLLRLSQQPFPSPSSPFFPTNVYGFTDFSINFNAHTPEFNPQMHFSISNIPSPLVHSTQLLRTYDQTTLQSVLKDSSSPTSDARIGNHVVDNTRTGFWHQGTNHYVDTSVRDHQNNFADNLIRDHQGQGLISNASALQGATSNTATTMVNPVMSSPNNNLPIYSETIARHNSANQVLSELEKSLFSDSQVACTGEENYLKKVASFNSLINISMRENPENNPRYNQQRPATDNHLQVNTIQPSTGAGYLQQAVSWVPPQDSNMNPAMYTPMNNNSSMYPPVFRDPMPENYVTVNSNNRNSEWNL